MIRVGLSGAFHTRILNKAVKFQTVITITCSSYYSPCAEWETGLRAQGKFGDEKNLMTKG